MHACWLPQPICADVAAAVVAVAGVVTVLWLIVVC